MQMFLHFYPAIAAMLSLYCYRRNSPLMQKFYRRMTFSVSARKLFVLALLMLMLLFNFCYLQSYGVSWALGIASLLCMSMFSFRMTERSLNWLQQRMSMGFAMLAMLACVVKPSMWPLAMNLYVFTLGSVFYPSAKLIRQLESPATFSTLCANPETLIKGYYSR